MTALFVTMPVLPCMQHAVEIFFFFLKQEWEKKLYMNVDGNVDDVLVVCARLYAILKWFACNQLPEFLLLFFMENFK